MNSSVLTIPIEDVFKNTDGCPLCKMHTMLEDRFIDFILGAAMMEPDIRIETNKKGFCAEHFKQMSNYKKKLPLALIMESHLTEIKEKVFGANTLIDKNAKLKKAAEVTKTCFVCENINAAENNLYKGIFSLYLKDKRFKETFNNQEFICLKHFVALCESAGKNMPKKEYSAFLKDATALCENYLDTLSSDVHHFTKMFDYQNANADWGNSKDSLSRSIKFLTGEDTE